MKIESEPLRLNIGSGDKMTLKGYVNLDAKFENTIYPLAYSDDSVDEVRASHVLEHFSQVEIPDVLKDWRRVLKPGGVLKIAVPNFRWVVDQYQAGNPNGLPLAGYVMGGQADDYDYHKSIFDESGLRDLLTQVGLVDIEPWESEVKDCASLPVSLNLMGRKPPYRETVFGVSADDLMWGGSATERKQEAQPNGNSSCPPEAELPSPYKAFLSSIKIANQYSQFNEDSIIEAIFERIGTANKWCVECGAGDGLFFSNTRRLIDQGWKSLQIEGDEKFYERLESRYKGNENVIALEGRVALNPGNRLDDWLGGREVPVDFDLLVLDVDGQEYHILNSLVKFRPRVIIVEYSPQADPMYIPEPGAPRLDQAGMKAIRCVAQARGYEAVCRTQVNLICVRRDLAHLLVGEVKEAAPMAVNGAAPVNGNGRHFVAGGWRESAYLTTERVLVRPAVVMSTPRYGPLDAAEAISEIGAQIHAPRFKSGGAFWEQGLTRSIELALEYKYPPEDEPIDVIVSMDYDTFATPEDAKKLIQLLYQNPQYDCIVPMQARRGVFSEVLATTAGPADMTQGLVPIVTGHFGLTVFRRRVFEGLKKPWLLSKADPNGGWSDGRTDADIHFWQNFNDCGFKAALAPVVVIGHGEDAVVYPRLVNGQVQKVYISVYEWLGQRSVPENAGVIG